MNRIYNENEFCSACTRQVPVQIYELSNNNSRIRINFALKSTTEYLVSNKVEK